MTKIDIIKIITTSKFNEYKTHYKYEDLIKLNQEELEKVYEDFIQQEYDGIFKDDIMER